MFDGYCILHQIIFSAQRLDTRQWAPREIQLRFEFVFVFVFIRLFIALGKVKSIFYSAGKLVTFRSLEAAEQPFKLVYMNTCTNLHVMQPINLNFYDFFSFLIVHNLVRFWLDSDSALGGLFFAQLNRTIAEIDWIPVAASTQKRI